MPTADKAFVAEPRDFSLVLGGPLYQLLRRTRLAGDALELLRRRIVVLSAAGLGAAAGAVGRGRDAPGADASRCRSSTTSRCTSACCWRCRC